LLIINHFGIFTVECTLFSNYRRITIAKNELADEIDKAIIYSLQKDGRRSYATIAEELGLSASAVQQRAQRLMERGVLKVRAVTNPFLMGVPVIACINLEVDGSMIREAAADLAKLEEVTYVVICAGSYDIQIEVTCRDNTHLLDVITEISKINGVRSTETFVYLEIVKNSYQYGIP
jgi:Lrp/AsnC family transcriptional regulator for asnA, asnC and gidA